MAGAAFQITISAVDKATAIAKRVNDSIAKITKPVNDVKTSVAAFNKETGLDRLGKGLASAGNAAGDMARKVASIAPPMAALLGVGSIAGIAALASGWGKAAVEIANTSSVLGVSTANLQRYRGAARVAGLSADAMTSSMQSLGSAFEDASAGRNNFAAGVLSDKGIGIHRLRDGTIDVVRGMRDVATAASKIRNAQAQKTFLDIFGMGGLQAMVRRGTMDQFVSQFDKLNAVMTPEQIAKGEQFNLSMIALDASVDKLKNSIGASLAPALGRVVDGFGKLADEYGPKIAAWIDGIDWDKTAQSISHVAESLGGVKGIALALAAITFASPIAGIVRLSAILLPLVPALAPLAALATGGALAINKLKDSTEPGHFVGRNAGAPRAAPLRDSDTNSALWDSVKTGVSNFFTIDHGKFVPRAGGKRIPLGIRTNNPLNILTSGNQNSYAAPEEGIAAAAANLQRNYRGLTLAQLADKWTGGARTGNSPEQIANYLGILSRGTGLSANQVPTLSDPSVVAALIKAQIRAENGQQPYSDAQIASGVGLGMPGAPRALYASAAPAPGAANASGQMDSLKGRLEVTIHMPGVPNGTRATVHHNGDVLATGQIGHSLLLGPSV